MVTVTAPLVRYRTWGGKARRKTQARPSPPFCVVGGEAGASLYSNNANGDASSQSLLGDRIAQQGLPQAFARKRFGPLLSLHGARQTRTGYTSCVRLARIRGCVRMTEQTRE